MSSTVKTIAQLLQWAVIQLADSESPKLDAEVILCSLLEKDRSYLFTWDDKVMADDIISRFSTLITRRQAGEPVAHILGFREFWSLELEVSPDTLIPRPDTEVLVEQALACMPADACQVLDLGTGTGAIALALASESPQAIVTAVEYQQGAAALARRNAQRCGFDVTVLQGSWFTPLTANQRFDVIVSNPPYIERNDPHLAMGDVRFEPLTALVADDDGLADLKHSSSTQMVGCWWSMALNKVQRYGRYLAHQIITRLLRIKIMVITIELLSDNEKKLNHGFCNTTAHHYANIKCVDVFCTFCLHGEAIPVS